MSRVLRSKACRTCRERRVKCDENKPFCRRCEVAKILCKGYPPALQFVAYVPGNQPTSSSAALIGRPSTLAPVKDDSLFLPCLENALFRPAFGMSRVHTWVGLNARGRSQSLSYLALSAMSHTFFGRSQYDQEVYHKGRSLYLTGITAVNNSLSDPVLRTNNDVLLSVYILSTYEMLFLTEPSAWIRHGLGLSALFALRGPMACRDYDVFHVFLTTRFLFVLTALATQSSTFCSSQEWKTLPFELQSYEKGHMDHLLDIVCELPSLRNDIASCQATSSNSDVTLLDSIAVRSIDLLNQLRQWHATWPCSPESRPSTRSPSPVSEEGHPGGASHFIESHLEFDNLLTANIWTFYHATHCLLLEAMLLSKRSLEPGQAAGMYTKIQGSSTAICRSVKYHLETSHSSMGQFFILWPLRVAWRTLGGSNTAEGRWVEQTLESITGRGATWEVAKETLMTRG